jgi:hypothetical protein
MLDDDVHASPAIDVHCACGHRYPEHSIEGTCRGCVACEAVDDDDHPYEQCPCDAFEVIG